MSPQSTDSSKAQVSIEGFVLTTDIQHNTVTHHTTHIGDVRGRISIQRGVRLGGSGGVYFSCRHFRPVPKAVRISFAARLDRRV